MPEWLTEGASLLTFLVQDGIFEKIELLVRINRQGGYCGLDVFLFFLLYHSSGLKCGIRKFAEKIEPFKQQFAALAGRLTLPTPASISRALKSVESSLIRPGMQELLLECIHPKSLLDWPACQTWDTHGTRYHVFDFDHTSEGVLQRALPTGDDLPQAKRRSLNYCAPGYLGRKRGDVKYTRSCLQHAGTGLYFGGHISKGNGNSRADFESALEDVKLFCQNYEWPTAKTIIRGDGAFGSVPYLSAAQKANLCLISRCQRYTLLAQEDVQHTLENAQWFEVPSSGTAPTRFAAELGHVVFTASDKTYQDDGSPYEPVLARVVVSRFRCSDDAKKASRGKLIHGYQYELYVSTCLEEAAFPAAELVSMFYQRSGQENRFAQEDRELELGRLFSENLAGQEFTLLAGLFVWNFRILRGFELANESNLVPAQKTRKPVPLPPQDKVQIQDADEQHHDVSHEQNDEALKKLKDELYRTEKKMAQYLSEIDWEKALKRRPNWTWDGDHLRCPNQVEMLLQGASLEKGVPNARFRSPPKTCAMCDKIEQCLNCIAKDPRKLLHIRVETNLMEKIQRLKNVIKSRQVKLDAKNKTKINRQPVLGKTTKILKFSPAKKESNAGDKALYLPLFLPAKARQLYRSETESLEFHINVSTNGDITKPKLKVLALDDADRQHCRKTWEQRLQWNTLPSTATISVKIFSPNGEPPKWLSEFSMLAVA